VRAIALVITGLCLSSSAFAADCAAPYTTDSLIGDLSKVEAAMREYDDASAATAGSTLRDGLGCLDEVLPALIAARAYRAVGAGLYAGGEVDQAKMWFATALELEPTWTYGLQDIPEGHPLRNDFEDMKRNMEGNDPAPVEGQIFVDGSHYLDGRKISQPRARLERFHVYQVDNGSIASHLIEGNAFPADQLKAGKVETDKPKPAPSTSNDGGLTEKQIARAEKKRLKAEEKRKKKAAKVKTTVAADGTVYYKRQRPPEKTPLMIAGGVIMAGAAALYYGSTRTEARMKSIQHASDINEGIPEGEKFRSCSPNEEPGTNGCTIDPADEVDRLAGVTNRLVVASAAVFAVGAGTTTWGIILDGDRVVPTVNIRF
jgi:hypothetical protein